MKASVPRLAFRPPLDHMRDHAYALDHMRIHAYTFPSLQIVIQIKKRGDKDMDELGEVFEGVSRYFALLSEPMRVRVLHALCQGEKTVSEVTAATGGSQTNVSRHLGAMFRAGALTRRQHGNFVYYDVGDRTLVEICRSVCVHVAAGCADTTAAAQSRLTAIARDFDPVIGQADRPGDSAARGEIGSPN